jgi:transposase
MSGDARDFNNIETRAVIKFFFLQGKAPKEIHAILTETLGEHAPSYATVRNWVAQFKRGDFSTCDAPYPGRPKTVTTPEILINVCLSLLAACSVNRLISSLVTWFVSAVWSNCSLHNYLLCLTRFVPKKANLLSL